MARKDKMVVAAVRNSLGGNLVVLSLRVRRF